MRGGCGGGGGVVGTRVSSRTIQFLPWEPRTTSPPSDRSNGRPGSGIRWGWGERGARRVLFWLVGPAVGEEKSARARRELSGGDGDGNGEGDGGGGGLTARVGSRRIRWAFGGWGGQDV